MTMLPVYVGLDCHADTIRVCILEPDGKRVFNRDEPDDVRRVAGGVRNFRSAVVPPPLRDGLKVSALRRANGRNGRLTSDREVDHV